MLEQSVIAAFIQDASVYRELGVFVSEDNFSDIGRALLSCVRDYYGRDADAESIDAGLLAELAGTKYPRMEEELKLAIDTMQTVSVPNVQQTIVDHTLEALRNKITQLNAVGDSDELAEAMRTYEDVRARGIDALSTDKEDTVYNAADASILEEAYSSHQLIPIFPLPLNRRLNTDNDPDGGVPRGTHILLYARPETGKTMFNINLANAAANLGFKVLYYSNEDPAATLMLRSISNFTGLGTSAVKRDIAAAREQAMDMGYGNIYFADRHPGSIPDIRKLVMEYEPDLLIVDQIRNVRPPRPLNKVEALEELCKDVRNITKEFNIVTLSVTQAGNEADQKAFLDMGDVDFSNTGMQAAVDVMIGLGVTAVMDSNEIRGISLPKNKPGSKHDHFVVGVDPSRSTILDEEMEM